MGLCTLPFLWELFIVFTITLVSCPKSNHNQFNLKKFTLETSAGEFSL
jgi:hypothetical protein